MKLALVADTFPPLRTSGAVQLRDLAREFAAGGPTDQVLRAYEARRSVEVLKIQNAARNSTEWFEHVERYASLDPQQFAYSLLTRSQRISHENLRERDPACRTYLQPFLYFKGFQALQGWRVAHWLWGRGRETLAFHFQSRISELFQLDIHPAARLGKGLFLDHGTGIVIGETAVVGDDVSMLHGVTLGGTGAERGDRHPKIGKGVLLGAGAKVLGNIAVGDYAKVASGSVVLKPVPSGCTVAGVPARLVDCPTGAEPARTMDHTLAEVVYDFVI